MGEREVYKKPQGLIQNIGFMIKHETTPGIIESYRRIALRNQAMIRLLVEENLITKERLMEISNDKELQDSYKDILHDVLRGNGDKSTNRINGLATDQFAGFLNFFLNHYEKHFDIKLLTEEERSI